VRPTKKLLLQLNDRKKPQSEVPDIPHLILRSKMPFPTGGSDFQDAPLSCRTRWALASTSKMLLSQGKVMNDLPCLVELAGPLKLSYVHRRKLHLANHFGKVPELPPSFSYVQSCRWLCMLLFVIEPKKSNERQVGMRCILPPGIPPLTQPLLMKVNKLQQKNRPG